MAGELHGAFFKSVIGALLSGDLLFPVVKARIAAMDDDGWYGWDEYCRLVNTIAEKLPPQTLRKCGVNLMVQSAAFYRELGFRSMADHMHGFDAGFRGSVRGAPPHDAVQVVARGEQSVVLHFGAVQPRYLCEGYIRGAGRIYGARLLTLTCARIVRDGHAFHEFRVEWRERPGDRQV